MTWKEEINKGNNNKNNTNNDNKRKKSTPHQWQPPTDDEENKCSIHGKPYTWNGKKFWIKDNTPDSGFESSSNITDAAVAATIIVIGQKNAAAVISAAAKAMNATNIPTTVGNDTTALTTETTLIQDQVNKIHHIQRNLGNLGTSDSNITTYLDILNLKE